MCGICGIIDPRSAESELRLRCQSMADTLAHRGPDAQGVWTHQSGVALGHRRLSILDLSEAGAQPMTSHDGRWVMTYNGEFYTFQTLRKHLQARQVPFVGNSDTEVLVNAIATLGLEQTLDETVGMFALAAWDKQERKLYLARDRFGQKPLFYGFVGEAFIFGSELRVLSALEQQPEIDPDSAAMMLRYNCIPAPHTIYKGLRKLQPAHWVEFSLGEWSLGKERSYWSITPLRENHDTDPLMSIAHLFDVAVKDRMISDVPLGAFLSGGIDSTLVVAAMQRNSTRPVKTFTIGFEDKVFDEANQAAEVAKYLGTDHTEFRLADQDMLDVIPKLASIYDEPFGDSSQVPTYLVSKLARQHVTVALSGDGGDEFFGGYNRHVWLPRIVRGLHFCPGPILKACHRLLDWPAFSRLLSTLSGKGLLPVRMVDDKLDKLKSLLSANGLEDIYRDLLSDWKQPHRLVNGARVDSIEEFSGIPSDLPSFDRCCLADIGLYLPDDILVKVDRASMAVSLEARAPFLDHRLAEYAMTLGREWKIGRGKGKILLRELLGEAVPRELFERPKMGFAVPLADWLRGPLRDWAESLLATDGIGQDNLLRGTSIRQAWNEHLSGRRNHHHKLWNVFMLLAWLEENRS
jgi:asparagine synthase (glutamine-hydrolysing)